MKKAQCFALTALLLAGVVSGCQIGKQRSSTSAEAALAAAKSAKAQPKKENIQARGLYLTGWSAGGKKKMQNIVALTKKCGLNAVVIDIKDSDGAVSFAMDNPWAKQVEAKRGKIREINHYAYGKRIQDIDGVMRLLKENNIYPIARIAVFSDDVMARVRPDMAVRNAAGGIWENRKREAWLNPYNKDVWDYTVAVATAAAKKGFKEIQWDYVRFPSDGKLSNIHYPGKTAQPPADVIAGFLRYSREKLAPYGVTVSADIFGLTGLSRNDMGIGQILQHIAENVDYICPMVYPSHFAKGEYGIANPDSQPYKIVYVSLRDAKKRVQGTKCKIRPWLQNFSLPDRGRYGGSHYGAAQIAAQIRAARDNGIDEFLMWDPNNRFNSLDSALAQLGMPKPSKQ
ncbi:MAG TPA: putative glycoside hydrolase [Armatimonadota bacterium]|nr:putative glycoside hydrolase [Armatimonadota bacterium]